MHLARSQPARAFGHAGATRPHLETHLVWQAVGCSAFLLGVCKRAHAFKAKTFAKVNKLSMLRLALARKASNERRAQRKTRYPLAKLLQQVFCVVSRRAVHSEERKVGDVLQRHVDILAHLWIIRNLINELVREVRGVSVEDAYPVQPIKLA